MSKKTERIVKLIMIAITIAIVFYNVGIATALKHLQPHATATGYEVELFGQVYVYED